MCVYQKNWQGGIDDPVEKDATWEAISNGGKRATLGAQHSNQMSGQSKKLNWHLQQPMRAISYIRTETGDN